MQVGHKHFPMYTRERLDNMNQQQVQQRAMHLQDVLGNYHTRVPIRKADLINYILEHQDLMRDTRRGYATKELKLLSCGEEDARKEPPNRAPKHLMEDDLFMEPGSPMSQSPGSSRRFVGNDLKDNSGRWLNEDYSASGYFAEDMPPSPTSAYSASPTSKQRRGLADHYHLMSSSIGSCDKAVIGNKLPQRIQSEDAAEHMKLAHKNALEQLRRIQSVHTTDQQRQMLRKVVNSKLMGGEPIAAQDVENLVDAFRPMRAPAGMPIITEGDRLGDTEPGLFVLDKGELAVYKAKPGQDGPGVKVFAYTQHGATFGEFSLHYNAPRAATIVAQTDSLLWWISRVSLSTDVRRSAERRRDTQIGFISQVPILSGLSYLQARRLLDSMEILHFRRGDPVISQGQMGNSLYILAQGNCMACRQRETLSAITLRHYKEGDYFGELAMLQGAQLLMLHRDKFNRLVGHLSVTIVRKPVEAVEDDCSPPPAAPKRTMSSILPDADKSDQSAAGLSVRHMQVKNLGCLGSAPRRSPLEPEELLGQASRVDQPRRMLGTSHVLKTWEQEDILQNLMTTTSLPQVNPTNEDLRELGASFTKHCVEAGTILQTEGEKVLETDPLFFKLVSGRIDCYNQSSMQVGAQSSGGRPVKKGYGMRLTYYDVPNEWITQLSTINRAPPTYTYITDSRCVLYSMSRKKLADLMARISLVRRQALLDNMKKVDFLKELSEEELNRLVEVMGVYFFKKGDLVCQTGEVRSTFFIIERGSCASYSKGKLLQRHETGDCLYQMALLEDSLRSADTVVESGMATLLGLERKDFWRLVGRLRITVIPTEHKVNSEDEEREQKAFEERQRARTTSAESKKGVRFGSKTPGLR
eukprot:TRINITY_DN11121_c0_g1_i2.p1 TRINITY_DN11121_c0_g1~~TRINITY_DN11121_c0_g1_i2.p1  ORF type:complete len:866 (+),score=219.28 TRINITY_DN11121_c0_g1_i2:101-2698(+)